VEHWTCHCRPNCHRSRPRVRYLRKESPRPSTSGTALCFFSWNSWLSPTACRSPDCLETHAGSCHR
jgi:hypothetical protein